MMKAKAKPYDQLRELFSQQSCWTMDQLMRSLNYSAISIRRFLKQIDYVSSFTHNSKWYTLSSILDFDKNGICFFNAIGFSRHGNLKQSIIHFIDKSPQGLSAKRLAGILSIPCHAVLNHMYKSGAIERFKGTSGFVYLSAVPGKKQRQLTRLESVQQMDNTHQELSAHSAVYVLVEYIKQPQASFAELSNAVAKKQIIATPQSIARFFETHDLKKTQDE
jgi:hypothetical protein